MLRDDGLPALVNLLPTKLIGLVEKELENNTKLIDIQVDLGRAIKLRFADGFILVSDTLISKSDIHHILSKLDGFDRFNRQGVPNTLHRVSRILNTRDEVVGLTLRYARELEGLETPLIPYLDGSILIIGVPGLGKAQPLSSKILTPTGWTTMKDVQVGDTILDGTGNSQTVVGKYPQGVKEIFEVTFSDNSKTHCCRDHLWAVKSRKDRRTGKDYKIAPLSELLQDYTIREGKYNRANYSIPPTPTCLFTEINLPLDPYLVGALLGDGGLAGTGSPMLSSNDDEILRRVAASLPEGYDLKKSGAQAYDYRISARVGKARNPVKAALVELGLWGCHSNAKFIPFQYLTSSVEARIALLQGLLDTDGWCEKEGTLKFSTTSPKLAEDFVFLVRSLGGIARRTTKYPTYTYKGEKRQGQDAYEIVSSLPEGVVPFTLTRKLDRYKVSEARYLTKYIKEIRSVGYEESACIKVSGNDSLYITDDFVITHNTSYLRCIANYVSRELCRETIVVDKTNEIAGYSDVPHPIVGLARRMQVKDKQALTMLEAVENHTPHTIIVDEIRDREEAYAAKTVAERGVQLIATCHGISLASVLKNPVLQPIMGGINVVTLGDDMAKHRGTSKTVAERETAPTFDTIIELIAHDEIAIHTNATRAIDALLAGRQVQPLVLRKLGDAWREIVPEKIALPEPMFSAPVTIGDMVQTKKKKG